MQNSAPNHYATLGLDRRCTTAQIRDAYRILAKRHHPDLNPHSPKAMSRIQAINAANDILSDLERRRAYDDSLAAEPPPSATSNRAPKASQNITQDAQLRIEEFLRGTTLEIHVKDPGNPQGTETYELVIPPMTAPGTRFRVPRTGPFARGIVIVRAKAMPGIRFKARGSDLRCDLKISAQRATQGGMEMLANATGSRLRITIPAHVTRGEILRLPDEGLPKPRGGRGDLLVRILYRPEVRITRPRTR